MIPRHREVDYSLAHKNCEGLDVAPPSGARSCRHERDVRRDRRGGPGVRGPSRRLLGQPTGGGPLERRIDGEALRWYAEEVLACEGELIVKTQHQLRSVHFPRDREWLQSYRTPDVGLWSRGRFHRPPEGKTVAAGGPRGITPVIRGELPGIKRCGRRSAAQAA